MTTKEFTRNEKMNMVRNEADASEVASLIIDDLALIRKMLDQDVEKLNSDSGNDVDELFLQTRRETRRFLDVLQTLKHQVWCMRESLRIG